jgi:hypothetical protein
MKGWESYKPNWYEARIKVESPAKFEELMRWMQANLQSHRKHTVWRLTDGGYFEIRFRFERDYILFTLRWS